ncbi:hypothetical protein AB833_10580 [Chromatiales bacterium (ex Bugula neritina AB1)]|nr:hypothetical protein AB833_10580 [Chromatiales bacterium (ex Bugula neritina AB1)]
MPALKECFKDHPILNTETTEDLENCGFCNSCISVHLYPTTAANGDCYSFRQCRNCDGVFLSPKPNPEQLSNAYSSHYYGESTKKFIGPVEWVIDRFRSGRARLVSAKLGTNARVLDLGCGNGGFLANLSKLGIDAHGIELPGGSAERAVALSNITVHVGTLKNSNYVNQKFDAITLWHVFEHLETPRDTLDLIVKMLKPGGRLYLSLPNPDSFQARLFKGDWLHHDPPRHLFYLGPQAMQRELEQLGLLMESKSFWSMEQNPFGIIQSILNKFHSERDILYESLKGNCEISSRYSKLQILKHKIIGTALVPFAVVAATLESAVGRGGTMELVFTSPVDNKK